MVKVSLSKKNVKQDKKLIATPEPGAIYKITSEPNENGLALCYLYDGVYTLPNGKKAYAKNVKWAFINVSDISKEVKTVKGKVVLYFVKEEDVIEVSE